MGFGGWELVVGGGGLPARSGSRGPGCEGAAPAVCPSKVDYFVPHTLLVNFGVVQEAEGFGIRVWGFGCGIHGCRHLGAFPKNELLVLGCGGLGKGCGG